MPVYTHGGDILTAQAAYGGEVLDFSANLNPLGMPAPVAEAVRQIRIFRDGRIEITYTFSDEPEPQKD